MSALERRQRGLTLVELIVAIVIIGVAGAGVLAALNVATAASVDPMVQKQALAIAESLLEEVQLQPFTFCDPDDTAALTASSTADCTTAEGTGAEGGETRYSAATPFDNVSDYHGFNSATEAPPGLKRIDGTDLALPGYSATVTAAETALGAVPATESLLITVTVTGPAGTTVVLQGYRTRYAPRAVP